MREGRGESETNVEENNQVKCPNLRKKFNRIVKDSGSVPKELRERSRLDTLQY